MDVERLAWFVRELDERPSSLHIGENVLYVGGWDGRLRAWSTDGEELWSVRLPDRILTIASAGDRIFLTTGLYVMALNSENGEEVWSHVTEGSADAICVSDDGVIVVATSSVYDIEHGDFLESACWRFSGEGELLRCDKFDERPWHLSYEEGVARLGLGRPRCGMLALASDEIEWSQLLDDDPVTCGVAGRDRILYGHAKGGLSYVENGKVGSVEPRGSGIMEITCTTSGMLLSTEAGRVESLDSNGQLLWDKGVEGASLHIAEGMELKGERTAWVCTSTTDGGWIEVLKMETGESLVRINLDSSPTNIISERSRTFISCEDGMVISFESELFQRRLDDFVENPKSQADTGADEGTEGRRQMLAKLRRLRGGN